MKQFIFYQIGKKNLWLVQDVHVSPHDAHQTDRDEVEIEAYHNAYHMPNHSITQCDFT
jgi:hypothetical protein